MCYERPVIGYSASMCCDRSVIGYRRQHVLRSSCHWIQTPTYFAIVLSEDTGASMCYDRPVRGYRRQHVFLAVCDLSRESSVSLCSNMWEAVS